MPELPDIELYLHCLRPRVMGQRLRRATLVSPFVLRTFEPPISDLDGRAVRQLRRLGKRIVLGFEDDLFMVVHLMIAGRLRWAPAAPSKPGPRRASKIELARLEFDSGLLTLTEASPKKRASIHVIRGAIVLAAHDPGGIDVLSSSTDAFAARLRAGNHTLKRALTDPRAFSGIGNAYSDEILHRAQLSPVALSQRLTDDQVLRLCEAARSVLGQWTEQLQREFAGRFPGPGDVTAFRPDFAAHGKFGQPCPVCHSLIQRIVYADNETNYCPRCQTGGKLLADRSLSRLLKDDWPRSIDEIE